MKIKIEEADPSDQDKLAAIFDAPLPGVAANLEKDEEEPQEVISSKKYICIFNS